MDKYCILGVVRMVSQRDWLASDNFGEGRGLSLPIKLEYVDRSLKGVQLSSPTDGGAIANISTERKLK